MTSRTEKAKGKLATLSASFDDLEAQLEPLFAQSLPELIVGLEPIQQAKLQTVLPYLVYDLIFIYLKSRGIDPKTHPVVPELDRVRQYFEKISNAENPPAKRTEIDKGAAARFIKQAITQATYGKTPSDNTTTTPVTTQVQTKITSKMLQRQQYEKELKDRGGEEVEEVLEVFGDGDVSMDVDFVLPEVRSKGKGKGKEVVSVAEEPSSHPSNKRRRAIIDPFAGYGDDTAPGSGPAGISTSNTPEDKNSQTRQSKKRTTENSDGVVSSPEIPGTQAVGSRQVVSSKSKDTKKTKKAKKTRKSLATPG